MIQGISAPDRIEKTMSDLLTTAQVAKLFSVAPHTIRRWAQEGLLEPARTAGGHLRFQRDNVNILLATRGFAVPEKLDDSQEPVEAKETLRVLVVDDEKAIIEQILQILEEEDYAIETAGDGFEAGMKISSFSPHLIFLDLLLPGVDGFKICQQIRSDEKTSDITVITMTGYATDDFITKARNAGANDCLAKPLDEDTILTRAREAAHALRGEPRKGKGSPKPSAPR
jgi:excisionase family DNA binding protein